MTFFRPTLGPVAQNIITVAAELITEEGIKAATIRNIAQKAGVLPPQIYRHVGNLEQLLDDVATYLWETRPVTSNESAEPLDRLIHAIEDLITFGLNYPDIYLHISKPHEGQLRSLWRRQVDILAVSVRRAASSGLLQVGEKHAVEFILPFCAGMIFTCLHETSRPRDISWLVWRALKPLLKKSGLRTTSAAGADKSADAHKASNLASQLKANLGEVKVLSLGERALIRELLERIASA